MGAFFNDPKLKQDVMHQLRQDRKLDRLMQGHYFVDGHGCHLGCLTRCNKDSHKAVEQMFNIPERIAYLLEVVFENLTVNQSKWWAIESVDAIPVGADLSKVHHELSYWLLGPDSPSAEGNKNMIVASVISQIRSLHRQAADGAEITKEQWEATHRSTPYVSIPYISSYPNRSARSAWLAASASTAIADANATARAAANSADSAAYSGLDHSGKWLSAWKKIADKSIEVFKSCSSEERRDL